MKKTLSLLCAACIAVGMQAQTYMVNDFESGLMVRMLHGAVQPS